MKTLRDVALQYKKSSAEAIYPGVPYPYGKGRTPGKSRAFKTGNLLTKFIQSSNNTPERISRETKTGYELVIDISPDGATYGQYVHNGTYKMNKRPFGELGFEEPKFIDVLNEFIQGDVDEFAEMSLDTIGNVFVKAGFSSK